MLCLREYSAKHGGAQIYADEAKAKELIADIERLLHT